MERTPTIDKPPAAGEADTFLCRHVKRVPRIVITLGLTQAREFQAERLRIDPDH
jgi:hypothetical protein